MFENPRRGRQESNFTTNVPKILDLKSSSEQIFFRKLSLGAPDETRLDPVFKCKNPFPYAFKSLEQERTYNVKDHALKLRYPLCRSLRGRRLKGRGKWIPGAREARKRV